MDAAYLTGCKCTVTNIVICLKAAPSPGSSNYDSSKGKWLFHLKHCVCSEVHQARHWISESSSAGGSASSPATAALLLMFTDCCDLVAVSWSGHYNDSSSHNPFSRRQWHQGQQLGTEFKLTVQFLCLDSQCMNSLPAGIVPAHAEWASWSLLSEGLSSRSLNSFSFTSTQKNILWWKPMILNNGNQENLKRK